MRRSYVKTFLLVLLLIIILAPMAVWMSGSQPDQDAYDAEHVIKPLISLYNQSPLHHADSPVMPFMPIEEIWAIEDERTQAQQPLVTGMRNGSQVLGYDAESQTFFCTIGTHFTDDAWPELQLYAQGAADDTPVQVAWTTDYWYDTPTSAVEDGYAYELFAYTDNEFQYINLVFTGLPIVTLQTEADIQDAYTPACVSISSAQNAPITAMAQVHERGGGYRKQIDKRSYRIEFQGISRTGRAHAYEQNVLDMGVDSDWLLLANASNKEFVHNYLAFDLYNRWSEGNHLFMQQRSRIVELFIGNEYKGMYQLMERVDPRQEILDAGGNPDTDMAVRVITRRNPSDRPIEKISSVRKNLLEYLYAPGANADRAFSTAAIYSAINGWLENKLTDEEFAQLVSTHVDIENFISMYLFYQIAGLTWDNTDNNLYIYMLQEDGKPILHLAPWDMDSAFFYGYFGNPEEYRFIQNLWAIGRMLDLNVMACRSMLHSMFESKCKTILSDEAIDDWIHSVELDIGVASAYLRESEKWYGEPNHLELSELIIHQKEQVALTRKFINERWPLP
ncbi:MAG: CotH kinase family protein [Clostridia bacterium]|nr:CotH kinase family protein [Clostridia bacterium]